MLNLDANFKISILRIIFTLEETRLDVLVFTKFQLM